MMTIPKLVMRIAHFGGNGKKIDLFACEKQTYSPDFSRVSYYPSRSWVSNDFSIMNIGVAIIDT
jgi:hypothetical protein